MKMHDLKTYRRNISVEFISSSNALIDYFPLKESLVVMDA